MRKMALGALIVAAAYLLLATVAFAAGTGRASWLWLVLFFVVFTFGELLHLADGPRPVRAAGTDWLRRDHRGRVVLRDQHRELSAGVVGTLWSHISHSAILRHFDRYRREAPRPCCLRSIAR